MATTRRNRFEIRDAHGVTADEDTLFTLATGGRPAGGPYTLTIRDGARYLTPTEYRWFATLVEHPDDDAIGDAPERVVFDGALDAGAFARWWAYQREADAQAI